MKKQKTFLFQDLQLKFKAQLPSLEAVEMQGTALISSCQDELSTASGWLALSDLNDSWGDAMATMAKREEELKKRLAMARNYQVRCS